ncbi:MAG TPA: hypothetical protein VLK65_22290 [Vicinamibacteria bacterium]|nr:hypothetical protein [Vicinamibacteria bacterium]
MGVSPLSLSAFLGGLMRVENLKVQQFTSRTQPTRLSSDSLFLRRLLQASTAADSAQHRRLENSSLLVNPFSTNCSIPLPIIAVLTAIEQKDQDGITRIGAPFHNRAATGTALASRTDVRPSDEDDDRRN